MIEILAAGEVGGPGELGARLERIRSALRPPVVELVLPTFAVSPDVGGTTPPASTPGTVTVIRDVAASVPAAAAVGTPTTVGHAPSTTGRSAPAPTAADAKAATSLVIDLRSPPPPGSHAMARRSAAPVPLGTTPARLPARDLQQYTGSADDRLGELQHALRLAAARRGEQELARPKNLVMALTAGVSELAVRYAWTSAEDDRVLRRDLQVHELVVDACADLLRLADVLGVDLATQLHRLHGAVSVSPSDVPVDEAVG